MSKHLVIKSAVTKERLRELRIRHTEHVLNVEEFLVGEEPLDCWVVTWSGIRKLNDFGYQGTSRVRIRGEGEEGMFFVALANPDGTPAQADVDPRLRRRVTIASWAGEGSLKPFLKDLIKELLVPRVMCDVTVRVPHGRVASALHEDLTISIWSSPTRGDLSVPATMWSYQVSNLDVADIGPWVLGGTPIITPEGHEVGALDRHNIYLYWDAVHDDDPASRAILGEAFTEIARLYSGGEPRVNLEVVRERYVTSCAARADRREQELRRKVEVAEDTIRNHQRALVDTIRECNADRHDLDSMGDYRETLNARLIREFESLQRMEKVVGLDWRGGNLAVRTEVLYCMNPETGDEHEIGAFTFLIDQRTSDVKLFNHTRVVKSFSNQQMHAPHVFPGGRLCLGNQAETIPPAVAAFQWVPVVALCFAFIENVNLDDPAGKGIHDWPISRTKAEIEEGTSRQQAFEEAARVVTDREQPVEAAPRE